MQVCRLRDQLFLRLPWETELRVSEAAGVRLDVLGSDGEKVMGRGGVERLVFVQEGLETDVLFFILESGRDGNGYYSPSRKVSCITRQWADQIIRQSAERVGLESNVNARLFTRGYAMNILNCGGPLDALQRQLGHRDVNTTPVCLRPFDEDLKRGFASLLSNVNHPL